MRKGSRLTDWATTGNCGDNVKLAFGLYGAKRSGGDAEHAVLIKIFFTLFAVDNEFARAVWNEAHARGRCLTTTDCPNCRCSSIAHGVERWLTSGLERNRGWVLCSVRVVFTGVALQTGDDCAGETVLGQHALDGVLNHEAWVLSAEVRNAKVLFTANEARIEHVLLLVFLFACHTNLVGVNDDYIIACDSAWRVGRTMLATKNVGNLHGQTTQHFAGGVYYIPLGLNLPWFG